MGGDWDGSKLQRDTILRKKDKRGAVNGTATGKGMQTELGMTVQLLGWAGLGRGVKRRMTTNKHLAADILGPSKDIGSPVLACRAVHP